MPPAVACATIPLPMQKIVKGKQPMGTSMGHPNYHAGAHWSLVRGSVHVCHQILRDVLTESRQRPLGAFGHPSSRRMPECNHGLGLEPNRHQQNIKQILTRCACCSSWTVKDCNRCWASLSTNFEKSINHVLLRTDNMQLKYKNKAKKCFFSCPIVCTLILHFAR